VSFRDRSVHNTQTVNDVVVVGSLNLVQEVHGDVTITTHRPPYRVQDWPSAPAWPSVAQARAQPSQLLQPRRQVVGFTGRTAELGSFSEWADGEADMAVRLVHAPGGQGKTRLALHLAAAAADAGWAVWDAEPNAASGTPADQCPLPASRRVLVVADYADRWPTDHLLALLGDLRTVGREANVVVRVLLLARSAKLWWPSLAERLDTRHDVPADAVPLAPLGDQFDAGVLFETAAASFANCLDVAVPDRLEVPEHPVGSSVLAVHMAALAAVDARRRQVPAPGSMHAVSAYLLSRDQTHWRALHRRAEDGYHTDPLTIQRTAYLATLLGSLPRTDARAALTAVGVAGTPAEADRIIDDHTVCYPPAKRGEVLEPIQPDRLGEDFIALVTPGPGYDDETAWLCDDWTINAADQLFTGDPLWVTAALPVLVEAASRWPHLVSEVVCPLLRRRPELALAAGGTVLARIAGLESLDPAVLLPVEQQLPDTPDAGLDVGAAALSGALYQHWLSVTPDPVERAQVHYGYAKRLARVARYQEAITALDEAIAIYLPRTGEGKPRVAVGLVAALIARGGDLASIGRLDEAITETAQAHSFAQQIAAADPELQAAALPLIATPIHNLGTFLHSAGRLEEARTLFEQAVAIQRRLASEELQPRASLALSLMGLALTLNELGDDESAAAAAEEAFNIRRALAKADPAAYLPDLAGTLTSLAAFAVDTESADRTLTLLRDGIEIFRRLADLNPAAYRPLLAVAYTNLGSMLTWLDRLTEAVEPAIEAVAMFRAARESNPAGHRDEYCSSLRSLASLLTRLQRWEEAWPALVESLPMIRERAADQRLSRLDDLEKSLTDLFAAAWELGRLDEALAAAQDAIDLGIRLVEHDTAAYLPRLGHSLLRVGLVLRQDDRYAKASVALEEATGIFRGLAVADSGAESEDLGEALFNLAGCLTALERPAEAVVLAAEAAEIYRRLSDWQPALYEPFQAQSLWECARAGLATARGLPAALTRAHAAVQLSSAHAAEQPALATLQLVAIQTMADLHDALGRPDEAADLRHQVGEAQAGRATTIAVRPPDAATPAEEPPAATGSMDDAALLNDGAECYRRGDVAGAFAAWFVISMRRNPVWAPKAEYNLGILSAEQGNVHDARLFFRRVADGIDPEVAPMAAMRLAALLREAGDLDGARAACRTAYRAAIRAADQAVATEAMSGLSDLLENDGDLAQAAAVLWGAFRAGDSAAMQELGRMWLRHNDPDSAAAALRHAANLGDPAATFSLGLVLQQQGDFDRARSAYWHAVEMSDPHLSSLALYKLGVLHIEQGDRAGAQELWQRCFDAGQPRTAPLAAGSLGMLRCQTGDVAGAQAAWQYVIDNGEPDLVARFGISFGDLLCEHGDQDGARTAWQTAVDTGRPNYAPEAAFRLGRESEERGDLAAARRAWEVAVTATDADRRKSAWIMLGEALRRDGDSTGAADAFRSAVELGDVGGVASLNLGLLLADGGDVQGARAAYEQAAAASESTCAASALFYLGLLLFSDDREAALAAWARAADTDDSEYAARAAFNIAVMLREDGDIPGAHAAFHRALAKGDPEITPYAALCLGHLHADEGAVDQAHAAYQMAIDSTHPEYAPLASLRLGALLWGAERLDEANRAFAYAVEMGDPETAARARQALDDLTSERRTDPDSRQQ
jgi:tetratricopeptide (TPR) repeat protein